MLLLDTTIGFHWYDLLAPMIGLLLLVAAGAILWGVVYFFVNLFREMHHD